MIAITVVGLHGKSHGDEIYGCYKKNNGQLRIVSSIKKCLKSEKSIILNQTTQSDTYNKAYIDALEARIELLENKRANYSIDSSKCLIADNSEASVNYVNGTYMSKTLIWNCVDYNNYTDQHIELFFTSYDGQCYRYQNEHISPGICNNPASSPSFPTFAAQITDFQLTSGFDDGSSITPGFMWSYTIQNTGNTTLFGLQADIDVNPCCGSGSGFTALAAGDSKSSGGGRGNSQLSGQTITVTLNLKMWDGTLLDSQTKSVISP